MSVRWWVAQDVPGGGHPLYPLRLPASASAGRGPAEMGREAARASPWQSTWGALQRERGRGALHADASWHHRRRHVGQSPRRRQVLHTVACPASVSPGGSGLAGSRVEAELDGVPPDLFASSLTACPEQGGGESTIERGAVHWLRR